MNNGKRVRRYSRLAYGLQWGKYVARWIATLPMFALLIVSFTTAVGGLLLSALVLIIGFSGSRLSDILIALLGLPISAAALFVLMCIVHYGEEEDHFLNPAPPEENIVLPDEELLVRASAPNAETQRAELLRATTDTTDTPPEQLLRATSSREERA